MTDAPFLSLPPEEQHRRTVEGEARAAAQLGITVEQLNAICAGPPRLPRPKPERARCPTCRRAL